VSSSVTAAQYEWNRTYLVETQLYEIIMFRTQMARTDFTEQAVVYLPHLTQLSVIRITLLIPGSSTRSHSSTWKNSAPTRKIPMKFYI
jgi:hypothetical protein